MPETVTLKLGGGTDPKTNNPLPTRDAVYRAAVWPGSTAESYETSRTPSSVSYRIALPALRAGDDVTASTKIVWRGKTYNVIGPAMVNTINTGVNHLEILMTRTTG